MEGHFLFKSCSIIRLLKKAEDEIETENDSEDEVEDEGKMNMVAFIP